MWIQPKLITPAEDPTILILPADTLPPDLWVFERYIAPQPSGVLPGATLTTPGGAVAAPTPPAAPYWWPGAPPVQGDNLLNGSYQSAVNTALQIVLNGAAGTRIHLYSLLIRCSPAGTSVLTVQDGTRLIIPAGQVTITAALTSVTWPIGLTIQETNNCTITLTAAGAGNITILSIQADRF